MTALSGCLVFSTNLDPVREVVEDIHGLHDHSVDGSALDAAWKRIIWQENVPGHLSGEAILQ